MSNHTHRSYVLACKQDPCDTSDFVPATTFKTGEALALNRLPPGYNESETLGSTNSYMDAPTLMSSGGITAVERESEVPPPSPKGWIIMSHAAMGAVTDHQSIMEEMASYGYVAVTMVHPDGASGIVYPNGDVVLSGPSPASFPNGVPLAAVDPNFNQALFQYGAVHDPILLIENITERYELRSDYVQESDLEWKNIAAQWSRDEMAVVDYLESLPDDDGGNEILKHLVKASPSPLQVVYMGSSFGGGIVGTTAVNDARAVCTINLDGTHQNDDLLGRPSPVPYLLFTTMPRNNEFFFHSLDGTSDESAYRFMVDGMRHVEITDVVLFPSDFRAGWGGGTIDATIITGMFRSFTIEFLGMCFADGDFPSDELLTKNPDVITVDFDYVYEWALGYFVSFVSQKYGPLRFSSHSPHASLLQESFPTEAPSSAGVASKHDFAFVATAALWIVSIF